MKQVPLFAPTLAVLSGVVTMMSAWPSPAQSLPPVVTVRATDPVASEPGVLAVVDFGKFTVSRTGGYYGTNVELKVLCAIGGTAINGVDYQTISNVVTIPKGAWSADVNILPLFDNLSEGTETVTLRLEPVICPAIVPPSRGCYQVGTPAEAVVSILDSPAPTNLPPVVKIVVPTNGASFTAPADVLLAAQAGDADGYVSTVEFFAGTQSLGVTTNNPMSMSPVNPFMLTWSNVPPGQYVLTAKASDNAGAIAWSDPVVVSVGPPPPTVVTIRATDPQAAEPGAATVVDPGRFTVYRNAGTNIDLSVFYAVGGTASNGLDYVAISNAVVIPKGAWSADILIWPLADARVEGPETVVLHVVPPAICAATIWPPPPECYLVGQPAEAVVVIADRIGGTNLPPTVSLLAPTNQSVFTVPLDLPIAAIASDADGYVTTVEFFAETNRVGVFTNPPPPPAGTLPPVRLPMIVWSNVPPGSYRLTARATDNGGASTISDPVDITVNSPLQPTVTLLATDPDAAEPCGTNAGHAGKFTFYRDAGTNLALLVRYTVGGTASNGVDYLAISNAMVIPPGAWSADLVIAPVADVWQKGTESVVLQITPPICPAIWPPPPDCYRVGQPASAAVVIHDCPSATNRPPVVQIVQPQNGALFLAPANVKILTDTLDPDGYFWRVDFFAGTNRIGSDLKEFLVPPPPGQHISYQMTWSNVPPGRYLLTAQGTDSRGGTMVSAPVQITVVSNLPPLPPLVSIVATDPVAAEGTNCFRWSGYSHCWPGPTPWPPGCTNCPWPTNCGPNTATFQVRRAGDTNAALTVNYTVTGTASNGVDYLPLGTSVVIPAGAHSASIVVVPTDDTLPEPIETIVLTLLPPPMLDGAPPAYRVGFPSRAAAIIVDNDQPRPPTLRLPDQCFHLRAPGTNGAWFCIESSSNLVDWLPICTNSVTDGAIHFVDPDAQNAPTRFYRAVPAVPVPQD